MNTALMYEAMALCSFALMACQRTESALQHAGFARARLTEDGFFECDYVEESVAKTAKWTLGRFVREIESAGNFSKSIEKRLKRFLRDRNRLAHSIFNERQFHEHFHTKRSLNALRRFASRVIDDAVYFERFFDAVLAMELELGHKSGFYEMTEESLKMLKEQIEKKRSAGEYQEMLDHLKLPNKS